MNKIYLALIVLIPCLLVGVTRTVSMDGTQQYTSIQTAINSCNNGDIVLVYPGRYVENINLNGHNITIASLYSQTPQQAYIDSTIIDGNLSVCIKIESGENATINGLTLVNNEQNLNQVVISGIGGGGGIRIKSSSVNVKNCIIRNCISTYGAGMSIGLDSNVTLTNNIIYNNRALHIGGGLILSQGSNFIFSDTELNSIYDNSAAVGMDIFVGWMEDYPTTNIILNQGSKLLTEPDNYFITVYNATATVSVQQSHFTTINDDVFVSPLGDDNNDGLSSITPFKTIRHALQVINSNQDTPRIVHLAAGTYSFSLNGQILPLSLKPQVKIVGAGIGQTVIDGEMNKSFFAGWNIQDVYISDINFVNCRSEYSNPFEFLDSSNIELRNLTISNSQGAYSSGIYLLRSNNIILENLDIGNTSVADYNTTISATSCGNMYVNNVISHDNSITYNQDYFVGFLFDETDVVLRNSTLANNTAPDAHVLAYQNVYPENSDNNLDMSNVLVYNNSIAQCMQAFSPVYLQNRFQSMKISNCTFAGNQGAGNFSNIFGYADMKNHISYNPGHSGELYLRNHVWSDYELIWYDTEVSISNSLFRTGAVNSDLPNLVTFTDNIFNGNPLFLGSVTDTLNVNEAEYYYLSANSPCINTGTPDTLGMNLPMMDLAGNYRVWNNRIDMGCYEYDSEPYTANDNTEYPPLPDKIMLSTYPNPVYLNGAKGGYTFIEFTLPEKAKEHPVIDIYNLKGQKVRSIRLSQSYNDLVRKAGLSKQTKQNGEFYSTVWDCKDDRSQRLASGIYIVKVSSGNKQAAIKMTLLK